MKSIKYLLTLSSLLFSLPLLSMVSCSTFSDGDRQVMIIGDLHYAPFADFDSINAQRIQDLIKQVLTNKLFASANKSKISLFLEISPESVASYKKTGTYAHDGMQHPPTFKTLCKLCNEKDSIVNIIGADNRGDFSTVIGSLLRNSCVMPLPGFFAQANPNFNELKKILDAMDSFTNFQTSTLNGYFKRLETTSQKLNKVFGAESEFVKEFETQRKIVQEIFSQIDQKNQFVHAITKVIRNEKTFVDAKKKFDLMANVLGKLDNTIFESDLLCMGIEAFARGEKKIVYVIGNGHVPGLLALFAIHGGFGENALAPKTEFVHNPINYQLDLIGFWKFAPKLMHGVKKFFASPETTAQAEAIADMIQKIAKLDPALVKQINERTIKTKADTTTSADGKYTV